MSIAATVRRANRILDKGIRFAEEMKTLCMEAGMLDDELTAAIERVFQACEFSAKNGRPTPSKKVYVSHVNQAFNVEIQIDLFFPTVRGIKHTIMNLTDTGTNFTEIALCETRLAQTMIHAIETVCISRHGAPRAISADDEYNCVAVRQFLNAYNIEFKPRPTRRHNKTGIVDRKNAAIKDIINKFDDEPSNATPETILKRATFLYNLFSGNKLLSSFELVRGYRPSVVGLPRTIVT